MKNRTIPYGYILNNGNIEINNKEADIVKLVFNQYISGCVFKNIAEQLMDGKIEFFDGKCNWNKNKIARMIENDKYKGDGKYPPIISTQLYDRANQKRQLKTRVKIPANEVITTLKSLVYCEKCGEKYYRRAWNKRGELWVCHNGCKKNVNITDEILISKILKALKIAMSLDFPESKNKFTYEPTAEIIKYNNAIVQAIEDKRTQFEYGKTLIMKCLSLKFKICKDKEPDSHEKDILIFIKKAVENNDLDIDILNNVIGKVFIDEDGIVKVQLKNGIVISEEAEEVEFYGRSKKDYNKNICRSFIA